METNQKIRIICPSKDCLSLLEVPIVDNKSIAKCPLCGKHIPFSPNLKKSEGSADFTFSFSKIQFYEKCPKAYQMKYIEEINEEFSTIEQHLGHCVHKALEWAYKCKSRNENINKNDLITFYNQIWDDDFNENIVIVMKGMGKSFYKDEGIQMLESFYERKIQDDMSTTLELEHKFCISLCEGFDYTGVIDRVAKEDSKVKIIDFKTGKRVPDPSYDLQLKSYSLYGFLQWADELNLCIEDLRGEQESIAFCSKEDSASIRQSLIESINKIIKTKSFHAKTSILCKWCGYNRICDESKFKTSVKSSSSFPQGDYVCPKCGGNLNAREGRYGTFFGCENFPDCRYTRD